MNRNIAVLVLDSVRKDFFDEYAERIQNKSSLSVHRAYAPSSWSTPSHASMFTGKLPFRHGIHTYHRSFDDLQQEEIFHTQLSDYSTLGVSANVFVGSTYGFDKFFDSFTDVSPTQRFPSGLDPTEFEHEYLQYAISALVEPNTVSSILNGVTGLLHHHWRAVPFQKLVDDGGKSVQRVAKTEIKQVSEPWFLFTNFMDVHMPLQHFQGLKKDIHDAGSSWSSDNHDFWELMVGNYPEYWSTRESVYSAYVEYIDRIVNQFIESVLETSDRETTIIVTADHGENHGEMSANGMANHKSSLSEQLLRVPLEIINPPNNLTSLGEPFSLLDLPQLVDSVATNSELKINRHIIPVELMGMSAGPEPPENVNQEFYKRGIRGAYKDDIKVVWDSLGNCQRYSINNSDPSEQRLIDDSAERSKWAENQFSIDIEEAVSNARSNKSNNQEVPESVNSRLEELGYK